MINPVLTNVPTKTGLSPSFWSFLSALLIRHCLHRAHIKGCRGGVDSVETSVVDPDPYSEYRSGSTHVNMG